MDFLRRLDPGRASAAAAARPALPSLMSPASPTSPNLPTLPTSLASLTSRLAASRKPLGDTLPGDPAGWPEGDATAPHDAQMPSGHGASAASFGGAQRGPVQAARPLASATLVGLGPAALHAAPAVAALRPNAARLVAAAPALAGTTSATQQPPAPLRPQGIEPALLPAQAVARAQAQALAQLRAAAAALAPLRPAWPLGAERGQPLSGAALQAHATATPAAMAASAPALHITIDRIDVRAAVAAPPPAPARRPGRAASVSLADYLRTGARPKAVP